MIPPWVPELPPALPLDPPVAPSPTDSSEPVQPPPENATKPPPQTDGANTSQNPAPALPIPVLAPSGRFIGTRRNLGDFAKSGNSAKMRQGLKNYVRKGYGGRETATKRLAGTARTAGALYSALGGDRPAQFSGSLPVVDQIRAAGMVADALMDALVEAIRPVDGNQDTDASRSSIKKALSDVLTAYPNADLLDLNEEQRALAIERFVAFDVCTRIELDVGKTIQDKAQDSITALRRVREMREYVNQTVAASFRKLKEAGRTLSDGHVVEVAQSALLETFKVFEEYL